MFKFGVDSFIWTENFTQKDLWIINKAKEIGFEYIDFAIASPFAFPTDDVKEMVKRVNIIPVITTTLSESTNLISDEKKVRQSGIDHMKKLINIAWEIGAEIVGGVNYAAWGYITGKPRTDEEWQYSVSAMKEICDYARKVNPKIIIAVECINRFETHFLNIACDAVEYCKDVGADNIKVHLDCFHMNIEEDSFEKAIKQCGKKYLGYMHVNENNRGIPGTGLIPWREIFDCLEEVNYTGPLVIESFDPNFENLIKNCAIWRKLADSGEDLARQGLKNLLEIAESRKRSSE